MFGIPNPTLGNSPSQSKWFFFLSFLLQPIRCIISQSIAIWITVARDLSHAFTHLPFPPLLFHQLTDVSSAFPPVALLFPRLQPVAYLFHQLFDVSRAFPPVQFPTFPSHFHQLPYFSRAFFQLTQFVSALTTNYMSFPSLATSYIFWFTRLL